MRYPKKLSKRADEILAARRQTAQERHRSAMAALNEQHPEINAAGPVSYTHLSILQAVNCIYRKSRFYRQSVRCHILLFSAALEFCRIYLE